MNKPFFAINLFCAALIVLNPLFFDRTLCLAWLNLRVLEIRKVPTIYNAKRNRTNCRKRVRVRRVRAAALKTYSLCIPLYSFCAFIPKTLTRPTYILLHLHLVSGTLYEIDFGFVWSRNIIVHTCCDPRTTSPCFLDVIPSPPRVRREGDVLQTRYKF